MKLKALESIILRDGISYIPYTQSKSITILDIHSRITYKLINKDKTLSVRLTASYYQELLLYTYEWANTMIIKSANNRWV